MQRIRRSALTRDRARRPDPFAPKSRAIVPKVLTVAYVTPNLVQQRCIECNPRHFGGYMSNETSSLPAAFAGGVSPEAGSGVSRETRRRVVTASFIGNFVEWFDYAVYGYLAATISSVFFPEADRQAALLATFGVFAVSFFVRPSADSSGATSVIGWAAEGPVALHRHHVRIDVLHRTDPGIHQHRSDGAGPSPPGQDRPGLLRRRGIRRRIRLPCGVRTCQKRGLYAAVVPASTAAGLLLGS